MVDAIRVSCFAPVVTINPKYRKDAQNDARFRKVGPQMYSDWYLKVPCGKCYLCRKKKSNSWRIRLIEECKTLPQFDYLGDKVYNAIFVCFQYSDDSLPSDSRKEIAIHIRKWRDLWRKKYGKSPRYFCSTDKGSQFGRLHLHLIIFNPYDYKRDRRVEWQELHSFNFFWRFGFAYVDFDKPYIQSFAAVTYVTGYLTGSNLEKDAQKHGKPVCEEARQYIPYVFVSRGLGSNFITMDEVYRRYMYEDVTYRISEYEYALPIYYRNKIFDYETRYWMRRDFDDQLRAYLRQSKGDVRYALTGSYYHSVDSVKRIYYNCYSQFDKKPNFKIYG